MSKYDEEIRKSFDGIIENFDKIDRSMDRINISIFGLYLLVGFPLLIQIVAGLL
jgi:hypothetical protein